MVPWIGDFSSKWTKSLDSNGKLRLGNYHRGQYLDNTIWDTLGSEEECTVKVLEILSKHYFKENLKQKYKTQLINNSKDVINRSGKK